jgi:uncharacterized heparinase superfamily protein
MIKTHTRRVVYRLVKPALWRLYGQKKAVEMSDGEFRSLFPFRQDLHGFLKDFYESARLRFFFHPRNQKDFFLYLLTQSQPYEEVLSDAQDVLGNIFEALGSGKIHLGDSINWQKDYRSGKEWPMKRLSAADLLDVDNPSDIKIPWEFNRFHQVWWLGKAYWATHNEEYARKFGELIDDWTGKNPTGIGPNWSIAMEVAIRACNWIAGYYFFCDSPSLSADFWQRFFKNLLSHGRYIESHLEYAKRNGNHLLSDVVGLLFIGVFFRSASFGQEWTTLATGALQEEMETQVYPDGVNYEKSVGYHRLVLELFYTATILCQYNKIPLHSSFMQRLETMFEFTLAYTRPDGSAPVVGDADDARLFQFSAKEDFNDHRHALSIGALLFNRGDFRTAAGGFAQDALWLFGGEGFEKHQKLEALVVPPDSSAFPEGGFYVMRGNESHLLVDAGDIGMKGRGGHGHNDTFGFEFWCNGRAFIVDSGTFTYSANVKLRNEFRSTAAHNTLMVDGKELADFIGLWSVRADKSRPRVVRWINENNRSILEAEHSAYLAMPSHIVHRRQFELLQSPLTLIITDTLKGTGTHLVESFLHFAPRVSVEIASPQKARARNGNGRYIISVSAGELSLHETSYSRSYGVRERNKALKLTWNTIVPAAFQTIIQHDVTNEIAREKSGFDREDEKK